MVNQKYSYPKNKIKVLLLENIDEIAKKIFQQEGYTVESLRNALGEEELIKKIKDIFILGIRSKTKITAQVLKHAQKLLAIGTFCIGTDQTDLQVANQKGIAVFNAPYSNSRSVVELVIGEIIMLQRKIFLKNQKMQQKIWDKTVSNCHEIRGKKLGIVGYGNIGSQISVLAENLGMQVYYFDIADKLSLGNAKKCQSLSELLKIVDVVTIHVDGRKSNHNLFSDDEFKTMKSGAIFLNCSRGHIVNIESLVKYIKSGKICGAAIDVFPNEPHSNADPFISKLQNLPNVILTPHIGGNTVEAQKNIGEFTTQKIIDFVNTGSTMMSVNFPNLQLPKQDDGHRFIHVHHNTYGVLSKINNILAKNKINITGQYLKTNDLIGYVITDINKKYNQQVIDDLKQIPETIKLRVLY